MFSYTSLIRCLLGALLVVIAAVPSAAQESRFLLQKTTSTSLGEIAGATRQKGYAGIIVELATSPSIGRVAPGSAVLASIQAQTRTAQDAIITTHFGDPTNAKPGVGFSRSLHRMAISPMFSLNASMAEINALAA